MNRRRGRLRSPGSNAIFAGLLTVSIAAVLLISVRPVRATDTVTPEQAKAIHFRETFGFSSDLALVQIAELDEAHYSSDDWGVPLSEQELADMDGRMYVQGSLSDAMAYALEEPDFGGAYIDQHAQGLPIYQFTSELDRHRSELTNKLPNDVAFRVDQAERTLAELLEQQAKIDAERKALSNSGVVVVETAILTDSVLVGVDGLTKDVEEVLTSKFGPGLTFEDARPALADTCYNGSNCRPIKGGIKLEPDGDAGKYCTSGFVVKRTDTHALALLTAGHCTAQFPFDKLYRHNGDSFGRAREETFAANYTRPADVGLISIFSAEADLITNANWMHRGAGEVFNVVRLEPGDYQVIGMAVKRYGVTSGTDAGAINAGYANRLSCLPSGLCMTVTQTRRVDFDSTGGDSGGPYWYPHYTGGSNVVAIGTHVHSEDETQDPPPWYGWYSPIDKGAAGFDALWPYTYTLCITASC